MGVRQFVFASSSGVYGTNPNVPRREGDHLLLPISPYASSKVSGELLGHVYSHLYGIRFVARRLFTVYGLRQRSDLAIYKFARGKLERQPIPVFGDRTTRRDYNFVGDVVSGIRAAMEYRASRSEVINLGNSYAVSLSDLIAALQDVLGMAAEWNCLPSQPGDVPETWADIRRAGELVGYRPSSSLKEGLRIFRNWLLGAL